MEKKKYVQKLRIVVLLVLAMSLIGGCFGKKEVLEPLQPSKIKVVYQDEEAFYRDYGKYFHMKYPQIEVEVIPETQVLKKLGKIINADDYFVEKKKLLESSGADVFLLDDYIFKLFAQDGKLYDLEDAIRQDEYDVDGFMPGLLDNIRNMGNGKLYGLAPSFNREVLYYNKALFKEHQIEPPRNNMTWQEVFDLAARFSSIGAGDNKVHGLYEYFGDPGWLMYQIADTSGLRLFDPKGEKVLLNSDGWKQAMRLAVDAVRNKSVFFHPESQIYTQKSYFFKGKAAMMVDNAIVMMDLKQRPTYVEGEKPIDWGVVTVPIDPTDPSQSISLFQIAAIAADSPNKRAAWELVKFVNGKEMAQSRSRTINGSLPSRTGYAKEIDGKSMEAFYLLKVRQGSTVWMNEHVPTSFNRLFDKPLQEEMQAVIDNKKSVDEALAELEIKGQEVLLKAREAEEKKP